MGSYTRARRRERMGLGGLSRESWKKILKILYPSKAKSAIFQKWIILAWSNSMKLLKMINVSTWSQSTPSIIKSLRGGLTIREIGVNRLIYWEKCPKYFPTNARCCQLLPSQQDLSSGSQAWKFPISELKFSQYQTHWLRAIGQVEKHDARITSRKERYQNCWNRKFFPLS